jgi:MFS family permease
MVKTMPRVRMSRVWDDSTAFMGAHGAALAPIVLAGLVIPSIGSGLASASAETDSSGFSGLLNLIFTLATLWGAAAITALAVEPSANWREAMAQGARRLLPLIGISIALVVGAMLFVLPLFALLVGAGLDAERMMATNDATVLRSIDPARLLPVFLYMLALFPLFLWLTARLSIVTAVVVAERNGLGAIARAWRLTRGHALRIIGVMLLYGVLAFVALLAVGGAAGAIGYLIGGNEPGLGVGAVIVVLASAVLSVVLALVQSVFLARLYVALTPQRTLEDDFA